MRDDREDFFQSGGCKRCGERFAMQRPDTRIRHDGHFAAPALCGNRLADIGQQAGANGDVVRGIGEINANHTATVHGVNYSDGRGAVDVED